MREPRVHTRGRLGWRAGVVIWGLASFLAVACSKPQEGTAATANPGFKIAAASDLANAFEEVAREYEQLHQQKATIIFGASGLLAKQIALGAPYDAFYAANAEFVDEAIASGNCDASTKAHYASGHIVIWTRKSQAAGAPRTLTDLEHPGFVRIAIANPDHAPYGRAAKAALERGGLWEKLRSRIVFADNVKHALQIAQTGNADAAIVSLSLALADQEGQYAPLEGAPPVEQYTVICQRGGNEAGGRKFAAFLDSERGRSIMKRYGFTLRDS